MLAQELSTPALTVDLDALERNLERLAGLCRRHGLSLRPHTKTHKTLEVARFQLARGAVGLTVAKVGEAEVMAGAGFDDILVAYPIMGEEKLRRLARIACVRRLLVSLDSEAAAQELSRAAAAQGATIGVLVEFDAGGRRCGLEPGPAMVTLAKAIDKLPGLKFRGLMGYFGNVWGTPEERRAEAEHVARTRRPRPCGISRRGHAGGDRLRRLHSFRGVCPPDPRAYGDSSRHLRLQRSEYLLSGSVRSGGLRGARGGDGGFHRRARPRHHRWRLQNIFLRPAGLRAQDPATDTWWKLPTRPSSN